MGIRALVWTLLLAGPARALWLIRRYGVDVPFWDDWEHVELAWRFPSALELWTPHNEHRVPVPKLVILALHRATGLDERAGMYASWICLLAVALILYVQFRRTGAALLLFVPVGFIVFTARQYENLLWGQGVIMVLGAMFAVATFALLDGERPRLLQALACAIAGSFSFGSALMVWPAGAAQLAARSRLGRDVARRAPWVWLGCGVLVSVAYLYGWTHPRGHPPSSRQPEILLTYFFGVFGASLSTQAIGAAASGAVLAVAATVTLVSAIRAGSLDPRRLSPAVLVLFSASQAALLTFGRSGFGVDQAVASRYATFSMLGVAGAWLLAVDVVRRTGRCTGCAGAVLALAIVGVLIGLREGRITGAAIREDRLRDVQTLETWRTQPDSALRRLYPSADGLRLRAEERASAAQRLPGRAGMRITAWRRPPGTACLACAR